MGSFSEAGWNDRMENYLTDSYTITVVGTTATAVNLATGTSLQPHILYGVSIGANPAIGSGDVSIRDGAGTATAGASVYTIRIASAASQTFNHAMAFPRGIVCTGGLIVSATTVTGSINVLFKARYAP